MNWLFIVAGVVLFLIVDYFNGKIIQKKKAAEQNRNAEIIAEKVADKVSRDIQKEYDNAVAEFEEVFANEKIE